MTHVSWKLRPTRPEDLERLFELHRAVFREHIEKIWGWDEATQRSLFRREMDSSATRIVEVEGKTAGYLQIEADARRLFLRNLALDPDHQGAGLGSLVVRWLQREAAGRGVSVDLTVFRTNPRAERFYERLGFRRTGRTEAFVEMRWEPIGPPVPPES